MGQRFEFDDGKSHKFWEIERKGNQVEVRYAAIGKSPRRSEREFESEEKAEAFLARQIRSKVKKGYVEVAASAAAVEADAGSVDEESAHEPAAVEADEQSAAVDEDVDEEQTSELAARIERLRNELEAHPHIELLAFRTRDPLPEAEVAARVATLDVGDANGAAIVELYRAVGSLEFAWRLRKESGEELGVDPQDIVGAANICTLDELLTSVDYLDQGRFETGALDGFRVFEWDEQMYGYGIECDGTDATSFVSEDGSRQRLNLDFRGWLDALFAARGYRNFPAVVAGVHHLEASAFVLGTLFGEADYATRYPFLRPDLDPNHGLALAQRLVPILAAEGMECELVEGRPTDFYEACLIFPYRFLRDEESRLEALISAARGKRTVLGNQFGISCFEQPAWDIGSGGHRQYWPMIADGVLGELFVEGGARPSLEHHALHETATPLCGTSAGRSGAGHGEGLFGPRGGARHQQRRGDM